MRNLRNRFQVGHLHLRICHNLQIHAARLLINRRLHLFQIRQVFQTGLYAKAQQRARNQRQCVAKQMAGSQDILSLSAHRQQCRADSSHARIKRRHVLCARQRLHTLLKIRHRWVRNSCIIRSFDAVAESIGHLLRILKLERYISINRNRQRAIHIRSHKRCIDCNSLFIHLHLILSAKVWTSR